MASRTAQNSFLIPLVLSLAVAPVAVGQGSAGDYERAASLRDRTADKVFRNDIKPQWLSGGGGRLCYVVTTAPGTREFVVVTPQGGTEARQTIPDTGLAEYLWVDENDSCWLLGPTGVTRRAAGQWDKMGVAVDPGDALAMQLKPAPGITRSRRRGGSTAVLFANQTKERLELFWLDRRGKKKSYGTILPGTTQYAGTSAGHAWQLVNNRGDVRGTFVASERGQVAVVAPPDGAKPQNESPQNAKGAPTSRRAEQAAQSPSELLVFIDKHNLFMRRPNGTEQQVTEDGTEEFPYAGPFEWSPGGRYLMCRQVPRISTREIHVVESSPRDQLHPKLHTYRYRKPGDDVRNPQLRLFRRKGDVTLGAVTVDNTLFDYPYALTRMGWTQHPEKGRQQYRFIYNARGHQVLRWVEIDGATGVARAVVEESPATFVDYSQKTYLHEFTAPKRRGQALWMSERSGWNHLYLVDIASGHLKPLTTGEWAVRSVDDLNEERGIVVLRCRGLYAEQDPYHDHFVSIDLDSDKRVRLTSGDGTHTLTWSPDRTHYIDTWSRVDMAPIAELRRAADGARVALLERADDTRLRATGWRPPERFVAKGRDGVTDIWGIVHWPMGVVPERTYPIIESIYAGPHDAHVPKRFRVHYKQKELAELGFVVVQIDGMGTNWRSKAFHDVCWQNLADAGFPDRKLWIQALAEKHAAIKAYPVGIYGGSAGGQSAMRALIDHADVYTVAAADCGCHDNRMDKIWWNEAWLGWPVGEQYELSSNVVHAHRMEGKLLLMVGERDSNVDPASTMQVVDALIRADKDFDLLVTPGGQHGSGESPYGTRRRRDFFVRHLLGREPRW